MRGHIAITSTGLRKRRPFWFLSFFLRPLRFFFSVLHFRSLLSSFLYISLPVSPTWFRTASKDSIETPQKGTMEGWKTGCFNYGQPRYIASRLEAIATVAFIVKLEVSYAKLFPCFHGSMETAFEG